MSMEWVNCYDQYISSHHCGKHLTQPVMWQGGFSKDVTDETCALDLKRNRIIQVIECKGL